MRCVLQQADCAHKGDDIRDNAMRLANKVVVVTGGASGIGLAICSRVVKEGGTAVLADIDPVAASDAASRLGPQAQSVELDVASQPSVEAAFRTVVEKNGRIDVLVNCAGIAADIPLLDTPPEFFQRVLNINLYGAFLCTQVAARQMVKQKGGRIINIASTSGQRGNKGRCAYGASKGGLITFTKVAAAELAPHNILVNAVAPGPVETPMFAQVQDRSMLQVWIDRLAVHRLAQPDEIAAPVVFLASDDASFITGHVLNVDGGAEGCGILPPTEQAQADA
jgi:NAD(P)-dependent dehydrogenase (short-subunit alcohol dehydrogenase family)